MGMDEEWQRKNNYEKTTEKKLSKNMFLFNTEYASMFSLVPKEIPFNTNCLLALFRDQEYDPQANIK